MFKDLVLHIYAERLNLALGETMQMKPEDMDKNDYIKHCEVIIRKIAKGEIKSPHISKREANSIVSLLKYLGGEL